MSVIRDLDIKLPIGEAHVYFANFKKNFYNLEEYLKLLSNEEMNRVNGFKFIQGKNQFICTRALLRILSGRYLGLDPKNIKFKYDDFGKPSFADINDLKFNVSHAGNMAAIVFVKSYKIGIDIEKIQYNLDVLSLARSFFSDLEVSLLENILIKEKFLAFYRCWTRKEACVKAEGSGLSFPLNSFSVSMDSDSRANFIDATHSLPNKNKWSLFSFRPSPNYISAIAVMGKVNTIKYLDLDNPSLEDYSPT